MPPRERQHEGFWFFVWGIILRLDWEPLRERTLDHGSGQTRMPPQSDGTRGFWFRGILSHARE